MGKGCDPNCAAGMPGGAPLAVTPGWLADEGFSAPAEEAPSSARRDLLGDVAQLSDYLRPGQSAGPEEGQARLFGRELPGAAAGRRRPMPPAILLPFGTGKTAYVIAYSHNPALAEMLPAITARSSAGDELRLLPILPTTREQSLGEYGTDRNSTDISGRVLVAMWHIFVVGDRDGWGVTGYQHLAQRLADQGIVRSDFGVSRNGAKPVQYGEARDAGREFERRFGLPLRYERKGGRSRLYVPTDPAEWQAHANWLRGKGQSTMEGGVGLHRALSDGAWFLTEREAAAGVMPATKRAAALGRLTGQDREDATRVVRLLADGERMTSRQLVARLREGSDRWEGERGAKFRDLVRAMRRAGVPMMGVGADGYQLASTLDAAWGVVASLKERGAEQMERAERIERARRIYLPQTPQEHELREQFIARAKTRGGVRAEPDPKRKAAAEAREALAQTRAERREREKAERARKLEQARRRAAEQFLARTQGERAALASFARAKGGGLDSHTRELFAEAEAARQVRDTGRLPRGHRKRKYPWFESPDLDTGAAPA